MYRSIIDSDSSPVRSRGRYCFLLLLTLTITKLSLGSIKLLQKEVSGKVYEPRFVFINGSPTHFCHLNMALTRVIPAVPRMRRAVYWNVLASPKNTVHNTPLTVADMGRSIWVNETI